MTYCLQLHKFGDASSSKGAALGDIFHPAAVKGKKGEERKRREEQERRKEEER
jgi:hypothetical protein